MNAGEAGMGEARVALDVRWERERVRHAAQIVRRDGVVACAAAGAMVAARAA